MLSVPAIARSGAALALLLLVPVSLQAGLPSPDRSTYGVTGNVDGCPFVFRSDGGRDELVVEITIRHAFDYVMPDVPTSVTLNPASGSDVLCSCCPLRQEAVTDSGGVVRMSFSRLGGHGTMALDVTTYYVAAIPFWSIPVEFTSPDLNGSCDPPPASATTIVDLALWAGGSGASDYNCDGLVTLLDLAIWAGGLGLPCDPAGCPSP